MSDDTPARTTAITVIGTGAEAGAWSHALRGTAGVAVERIAGSTADELLESLSREGVDAVAFVSPVPDLPGAVRRAVMAGRHVLVAGMAGLGSKQMRALGELSRRRERIILFDAGALGDERLAFVRKMTAGPQALWRPRYIRSLRTGAPRRATLDDLVVGDIAIVLSLTGGLPSGVSAVAPRGDDETGAADVAMLTLSFDAGPIARIDVSLMEPEPRHELVLACEGRTVLLDTMDARAPLQIHAAARHGGPQRGGQWAETVIEHPAAEPGMRINHAAEAFVTAVRRRDVAAANADAMAAATLVWETARASIGRGGEMCRLSPDDPALRAKRPALHLIQGGGHRVDGAPAPELTVVGQG